MTDAVAIERAHQDEWYARAIEERFFDREGFKRLIARNLEFLRRAVPFTPSTRVLSLGCGTGEYELALAPTVGHLVGIDLSAVAIAEASRRARAEGLANITFQQGALLDLTFPDATFDVVYALGVLHHLSSVERRALLAKVLKWLAPGGVFYARDPNASGLLRRAAGWSFRRSRFHSPNESALDPRALREELSSAGLREMVIGYTDVLGGPLPWLLPTPSPVLWSTVFLFDRIWLATPGLQALASQFDIRARR